MGKLKYWGLSVLAVVLIGAGFWWGTSKASDQKDPLNNSDAFLYDEEGSLYWFELSKRNEKVEGTFYQQKLIEEIGQVPLIEEKKYSVSGRTTEKGYELHINKDDQVVIYDARMDGKELILQKQGENSSQTYKAIDKRQLQQYKNELQDDLETAIYHSENKEKERLKEFFSELNRVYGYLSSEENETFQVFFQVDEALLEGAVMGSLLLMEKSEDGSYKETNYEVNGITDGLMIRLYTTVDGESTKLEGRFLESSQSFEISFWLTDKKLTFHVVTEDEYHERYKDFKENGENG